LRYRLKFRRQRRSQLTRDAWLTEHTLQKQKA
jgi:hypothetical protein